ncbi:anoctamin-like protein [Achlya hypogyna]|uniref:Anoctamin-like protein n=1 Tax=Achlya hypogyna TaxID=1202772 RepID=A0A1V9ZT10_ACHHY|nr:anoctamin-like protein [Achlya hypogyna]
MADADAIALEIRSPTTTYAEISPATPEPAAKRATSLAPQHKRYGATDLVLLLPLRKGDELKNPTKYSQKSFVKRILGLTAQSQNDLKAIFKSAECFVANDGRPYNADTTDVFASADWVKTLPALSKSDPADQAELTRRIECLRQEYIASTGSAADTTEEQFCELMARAVAKRIQLVCGLTTSMFKSHAGDVILVLIEADEGDLKIEAERTKYRLQTSNKPFDVVHEAKLARLATVDADLIASSKAHLQATRGGTKGILASRTSSLQRQPPKSDQHDAGVEEPEMDPWLITKGAQYQVKLHRSLMMWGHNEAADGNFPSPPIPGRMTSRLGQDPNLWLWQRFRNELIYIPRDSHTYFSLYTPYKSEPKFQPYYRHYPVTALSTTEDTLFRPVDRIRLARSILEQQINFDALKDTGYFTDLFALHDHNALLQLRTEWALNWRLTSQPVGVLRDYFGEKIALYFAWLEFYTKSLALPAAVGIIIYALDCVAVANVSAAKVFFAGFIVVWSTFFTEFWKRKSELYNVIWGIDETLDIDARPRTQYIGTQRMSPVDNSPQVWDMATKSARRRRWVSYLVVLTMVLIVLVALGGLFFLKHLATSLSNPTDAQWASTGVSILNSVQITLLNMVYRTIAERLNVWENHRTDVQYENHLITKIFLFQFCNSFASFFYIAYIKAYIGDKCIDDNCLMELRVQLLVLFLIATFVSNFFEVMGPRIYAAVMAQIVPKGQKNAPVELSDEEQQALWARYEEDDAFADYNEMVIQYGYVTLFVVAMPITPALALLNNILELHVDAFKICDGHRRPFPHRVANIGSWYHFLCVMNYLAVATNIGILLFTKDPTDSLTTDTSTIMKWVLFVVAEHVCVLMKAAVAIAVPDVPRELEYLRDRHKDIEATVFLGQLADDDSRDDLAQQAERLDLYIHETAAAAKASAAHRLL